MFILHFGGIIIVPFSQRHNPSHSKQVGNHLTLNLQIQLTISIHTGTHINLNQPRLQSRINQNIKAKHLKARINIPHILIKSIKQNRFPTYYSLGDKIIDALEELLSLGGANVVGQEGF